MDERVQLGGGETTCLHTVCIPHPPHGPGHHTDILEIRPNAGAHVAPHKAPEDTS